MHKSIESHDTRNLSNITTISIMYFLQKTGELLQVSCFGIIFHNSTTNICSTTTTTITAQIAMTKWQPLVRHWEKSQLKMYLNTILIN